MSIILLYSQSGYFIIYLCTRYQVKIEMKERLMQQAPVNGLEEICYTDHLAAIRWEEEGEEFTWNDQLYDVARIVTRNGKTWLLCMKDGQEEALLRQLCAASQHNDKKNGHQGRTSIADDFTLPPGTRIVHKYTSIQRLYSFYIVQLLQPAMAVIVPPPRC